MANKKLYSIEINGLQENIKSVDTLTDRLNELQKIINSLSKNKLDIPIQIGGKDLVKELQSIKTKIKQTTKGTLPIADEKEYIKLLKQREDALEKVNKEMGDTNLNAEEFKKETKELVAIETKARNEAKGYANTLNGLKQELKDLNGIKGNIDLGSDEYLEVSERIYEITQRLKDYEQAQGNFSRNVGNYANSIKEANQELGAFGKTSDSVKKSVEEIDKAFQDINAKKVQLDVDNLKEYGITINDIKTRIKTLGDTIENSEVGSEQWKAANQELVNLQSILEKVKRDMESFGRVANDTTSRIKLNINGVAYEYNGVQAAIKGLTKEMQNMAVMGKQDTEAFKQMADAVRTFRAQTANLNTQIDELTKYETKLQQMVGTFQGFSAMASVGQGLGGLFGFSGDDASKQTATMTQLLGVMQGLNIIQQEMKNKTGFGQMLEKWTKAFNQLTDKILFVNTNLTKSLSVFTDYGKSMKDASEMAKGLASAEGAILSTQPQLLSQWEELQKRGKDLGIEFDSIEEGAKKLGNAMVEALRNGGDAQPFSDLLNDLQKFQIQLAPLVKGTYNWADALKGVGRTIVSSLGKLKELSKYFKETSTNAAQANGSMTRITSGFRLVTTGAKGLTLALKALAKATVALALLQAALEAVTWLFDGLKGIMTKIIDQGASLVNTFDTVSSHLDNLSKSVNRYNAEVDKMQSRGMIDSLTAANMKMGEYEETLKKVLQDLKDFNTQQSKDFKWPWEDSVDAKGIENIEEFRKEFEALQTAVENGVDITKVTGGNWLKQFWYTAKDAREDYSSKQKEIINDIANRINNLDLSKGKEELDKFFSVLNQDMYQTSIKNIENLYPDEEWAKVLKARLDAVQEMYDGMTEAAENSADAQIAEQRRIRDVQLEVAKQIRDNNTEGIYDNYERQLKQLQNQRADAIAEINKSEIYSEEQKREIIASIDKKYDRLEFDALQAHQKELENKRKAEQDKIKSQREKLIQALKDLRDLELENEQEGLAKQIKALENQRADAIQKIINDGVEMESRILQTNIKYDKLIEKAKQNHYDFLLQLAKDYARKRQELELSLAQDGLDQQERNIEVNYNEKVNSSNGSFDFNAQYKARIDAEKQFNDERLKIEIDYLNEKEKLDKAQAELDFNSANVTEQQRYDDALRQLEQYHKQGQLSTEEYNDYIERENKLHNDYLLQIEERKNNELINLTNEYQNTRKETVSESIREEIDLYSQYTEDVSNLMANATTHINKFGVMDYSKTKADLKAAKEVVKQGLNDIQSEYKKLDEKLQNNEITFVDYKEAKQQLQQTEKTLNAEGKQIDKSLSDILKDCMMQWKSLVDGWASQVSSLLNTLNDTQMQLIENEMAQVEHQLDIVQEAYDKAEEKANAHKDKMNAIEDELSNARGSRRQFLIDNLAAQQEAYLKDLAAQQEAQKQKEALEKKQEALEKKRKEQQKKANIQQAIMNTFTAASNALAVQPWFVGAALAAVATAMGMANVMAIKNTPIYEDGGVIQGKRHSQGGVKVLGGQAEVEGGEYITNRKSTAENLPLLDFINSRKREVTAEDLFEFFSSSQQKMKMPTTARRFKQGGQLPTIDTDAIERVIQVSNPNADNATYVVQVTDIIAAEKNLKKVQTLAGLVD